LEGSVDNKPSLEDLMVTVSVEYSHHKNDGTPVHQDVIKKTRTNYLKPGASVPFKKKNVLGAPVRSKGITWNL
jgi:hypothetical protein